MRNKLNHFVLLLLAILCISSNTTFAQNTELADAQKAESTMVGFLKKMDYLRKQKTKSNLDSLYAVNQHLRDFIMQHNNLEYMLTYDFKKLKAAGMQIHTSADTLCRTFVWNVTFTGPMRYRNSMLMYKANTFMSGNLYDKGAIVSDIITLHIKSGETIYLVHNEDEYQLENRYQGYYAYDINDEYFETKRIFFIGSDAQPSAGYRYDMSSFNKPYVKTQPVTFSKDMKYIYVPIIKKDGIFPGDYLIYEFDGNGYHYIRAGKK